MEEKDGKGNKNDRKKHCMSGLRGGEGLSREPPKRSMLRGVIPLPRRIIRGIACTEREKNCNGTAFQERQPPPREDHKQKKKKKEKTKKKKNPKKTPLRREPKRKSPPRKEDLQEKE